MDSEWKPEEHLGEKIKIKIDHGVGSKDPECGFFYPVNYGHVVKTLDGDGEKINAYLLGVFEPVDEFEGRLIGILRREDGTKEKLVVSPRTYSMEQIVALVEFREKTDSFVSYCYDKPYWPEEEPLMLNFDIKMPEVRRAIEDATKYGVYSVSLMAKNLKKGYGYASRFGLWLEYNGICGEKYSFGERDLKVKSYEEAVLKIKSKVL